MPRGVEEFVRLKNKLPKDYRIDKCKKVFGLNDENVVDLFVIHMAMDREGLGFVETIDFFDKFLEIPSNLLTESVLKLIDNKKLGFVSFGEFLDIVCTYCCFEIQEIIRFVFYTLDAEKIGTVDKNEVKHFVYNMYYDQVTSNIHEGLNWLDENDRGDGRYNYADIWTMHIKYPNLFYPAFRIQTNIVRETFGEQWWNIRKAELIDTKEERRLKALKDLKKQQEDAAKTKDSDVEIAVKRKMGILYWIFPCGRDKERKKQTRIAAISAEMEKQMEQEKKVGHGDD